MNQDITNSVNREKSFEDIDPLPGQTTVDLSHTEITESPIPVVTSEPFSINLEDVEKEIENDNDEEINFEITWQQDLDELENALQNESVQYEDDGGTRIADELEEVRTALENNGFSPDQILEDFHIEMEKDILHVTSLSAEELKEAENVRIQAELERVRHEAEIQRRREAVLDERKHEAKQELHDDAKEKQQLLQQKKELIILKARLEKENLVKSFSRSEAKLKKVLAERQAEVQSLYGDLSVADDQYGGARGRRWRVEWSHTPQPVQIKINCVRGLKDKIPVGRYAIMVSLYDRLGGHPMLWSNLEGSRWGTSTLSVAHSGKYFNSELKIDQSVFTVLPSKSKLKPGMVLAFELFLLRGSQSPTDAAVAWGAFPISDANFDILSGSFKTVLLRGHMDQRIDRFERIEQLISAELDHWLGNIYFEIIRLPRYLAGQKEYEVELLFSSSILNSPDRVMTAEQETNDGERIPTVDGVSLDDLSNSIKESSKSLQHFEEPKDTKDNSDGLRRRTNNSTQKLDEIESTEELHKTSIIGSKQCQTKFAKNKDSDDEEEVDMEWEKVEGEKDLYYKQHILSPAYKFGEQVHALLPQNKRIREILEKAKPKKLSHLETLAKHKYSIIDESVKTTHGLLGSTRSRINYCSRVLLTELGLSQWRTLDFWILMVIMTITFFIRIYYHYCGQWLFISAIGRGATVSAFTFKPYTVDLIYQADLLSTGETIGMVLFGPMSNIFVLASLALLSFLAVKIVGAFHPLLSQFILMHGLWTILDPIAIAIVDACLGRFQNDQSKPIADAYKLFAHFLIVENSGLVGIPITIFNYLVEMILATSIFYVYFLKIHNNGRVLDTYHRLHGEEEDFLVPYDQELSAKELTALCRKAEAWRGIEGERRKTIVTEFVWKEKEERYIRLNNIRDEKIEEGKSIECLPKRPWFCARHNRLMSNSKKVTVHVAIFTIHLDGLREVYRQFLRLPDGAIIEVYGDISSACLSPDVKAAMMRKQAAFEEIANRNENIYELDDMDSGINPQQDIGSTSEQNNLVAELAA